MAKRERADYYMNQRVLRHVYNCVQTDLFHSKLHAGNSDQFAILRSSVDYLITTQQFVNVTSGSIVFLLLMTLGY